MTTSFDRQSALPGTAGPGQRDDAVLVEQMLDPIELPLPTDQRREWNRKRRAGRCGDRFGGRRRDPLEARVLLQNRVLEPAQTRARFETKFFVQRGPCP